MERNQDSQGEPLIRSERLIIEMNQAGASHVHEEELLRSAKTQQGYPKTHGKEPLTSKGGTQVHEEEPPRQTRRQKKRLRYEKTQRGPKV